MTNFATANDQHPGCAKGWSPCSLKHVHLVRSWAQKLILGTLRSFLASLRGHFYTLKMHLRDPAVIRFVSFTFG